MGFQSFCFLELMDAFDKHDAKIEEMERAAQTSRRERDAGRAALSTNHSVTVQNDSVTLMKEVKYRDTMIASLSAENKRLEELVMRFAKLACGVPMPKKESQAVQASAQKIKDSVPTAVPEIPATIGFAKHIPTAPSAATDPETTHIKNRHLEMMPSGTSRRLSRFPTTKSPQQKMTYAIVYLGIARQNTLLANVIVNIAKQYFNNKILPSTISDAKNDIHDIPVLTAQEKEYLVNNIEQILLEKQCFVGHSPEAVKIGARAFDVLESSDAFQRERQCWLPHQA